MCVCVCVHVLYVCVLMPVYLCSRACVCVCVCMCVGVELLLRSSGVVHQPAQPAAGEPEPCQAEEGVGQVRGHAANASGFCYMLTIPANAPC